MRICSRLILGLLFIMSLSGISLAAVVVDTPLDDPAQEERARGLMKEIRCVVCQNQSIEDSAAEMAMTMRALVREQIVAGKTNDEIKGFLVERYGDWILMEPPMTPQTFLLWFGPIALLIIGGLTMVIVIRAQKIERLATLTNKEVERLEALLKNEDKQ